MNESDKRNKLSTDEVVALLRRVATGEVIPKLLDANRSWDAVYCGDVEFIVDGYKVVIFNDCDEFDYIEHVISPDGRLWEFDGEPLISNHPDELFYRECPQQCRAMEKAFAKAKG